MPDLKSRKFYRQLPTPFIAAGHKATKRLPKVSPHVARLAQQAKKNRFVAVSMHMTKRAETQTSLVIGHSLGKFRLTRQMMERLNSLSPEKYRRVMAAVYVFTPVPLPGAGFLGVSALVYAQRAYNRAQALSHIAP